MRPMTAISYNGPLFDDLPPRKTSPLAGGWVLLALAIHLALLTLLEPERVAPMQPVTERTVNVVLEPPSRQISEPLPATPAPLLPEPVPAQEIEPGPATASPVPAAPTTEQTAPTARIERPPTPEAAPPTLSVERLLDAVAAMDWSIADASEESSPKLSRPTDSELLDHLRRPVLPGVSNRFDGMTSPSEVEIMDRWMGADGTHEVVVRSPDGNVYCGRQGPVDDLRPWLQMPMMFRPCGGGGKRSGSGSWRNN